eukprot:TRINITY_DN33422_c0_g1_i3.p1 TRINITY_DN33422_c0_g1~~TRINITY_DN33422_c0_g1_i3.p1  ORF type:complete len:129 (+),score=41.42 TRINITY_DN33422_c0_g1_i3:102-488(+)
MSKPYSSMLVSPSRLPAESPLRRSLGIHLRSSGNGSLSHSTPFHRKTRLLKGELQKQDQEYQRKIEILQGKMEKDHRHLERRLEKEKMALNIAAKYLSDDQMKRVHREFEEARQSSPANSVASPRSIH